MIKRRNFLKMSMAAMTAAPEPNWGGPVLDTHLHLRREPDACWVHMHGCGVSHAVLLTRDVDEERAVAEMQRRPGKFVRSVSADPTMPGASEVFQKALRGGAVNIGELKYNLALDSPEMARVYDIAAENHVPVMMHIQVFPHFPGEKPYNTGFDRFDKVLRAHPRTTFVGHGDFFWANISADVPADRGYPMGPVKTGGLSDRWLGEFANLYADMSANSGNNALSRDPEFAKLFLARHQDKLIFGSDCSCTDGKGGGVSQNNNPEAQRLAGKCVARETLALSKRLASLAVFRKITWTNGARLFGVPGQPERS